MNISLPSIVIVGFVAAIAAIACAVYFASQNSASSTIVLAVAAFCGTLVILILQSWLELQSDETVDSVSAEYTLDRSKPEIASAFYSDENPGFIRGIYEQEASNDYFAKHPEALNDKTAALGQEKAQNLGQDMALYSFIVMLFNYQYDWQIRPVRLRARYAIGYETSVGLSRPDECSMVSSKHLNELLAAVENRFAEGVFDRSRKEICLPPNSRITVSSRAVTLSSPLYTMEFKFASPIGTLYGVPKMRSALAPATIDDVYMPDGVTVKYENMLVPVQIRAEFHRLYAKHPSMQKLKKWAQRLTRATRSWYEGEGNVFRGLNRIRTPESESPTADPSPRVSGNTSNSSERKNDQK